MFLFLFDQINESESESDGTVADFNIACAIYWLRWYLEVNIVISVFSSFSLSHLYMSSTAWSLEHMPPSAQLLFLCLQGCSGQNFK